MEKKLLLLDGMAIVYRAYYALNRNPRINSKGLNTSAILGFTTTLYDLIRTQNPTHIGVAFDLQAPTFRHEKYEQYKANREAMPEDIQLALPHIKNIITGFNIPILTCEGYEADDVIGTLSVRAEKEGFKVMMVTPDKDFGQIVTDNISMYRFGRMGRKDEILGVQEVCEKFSVSAPIQVIDILALWGDASDNIPGIPGVGEKKTKQLVAQFGSVEKMIEDSDLITNEKLRNLVKEYASQALFSKELATIALDTPIDFSEEQLLMKTPNFEALSEIFEFLEFKNFAKRFFADYQVKEPEMLTKVKSSQRVLKADDEMQPTLFDDFMSFDVDAKESIANAPFANNSLTDIDEKQNYVEQLLTKDVVAFYFVADSFQNVGGVSFATTEDEVAFLPLDNDADWMALKAFLECETVYKITYNSKLVKHLLHKKSMDLKGKVFDVQLAHYLLYSEARHTLDYISSALLSKSIFDLDLFIGKKPFDFVQADKMQLCQAACERASVLFKLYPLLEAQLKITNTMDLFTTIEMPLVDVLLAMEREGVRIDTDYLSLYSAKLQEEKEEIEKKIYDCAGEVFNISSPKQLGEVLFEKMKIVDKAPKTATKQYSTAEDVLLKMVDKHPIVPLILEYRSLSTLISTYLDALPKLISPDTNRLHTSFNQTVTATGRLSSNNPNLQNIPIRTERGREIRKAFVPRNSDYVLLAADYSQIELRIIAALSKDKQMVEAFSQKYDIHTSTAARIYKVPMDEVTADQRRNAKSVNFGIVYGISAFGLSEQLNIPRKEAAALIEEYFAQYPDIKHYIETNIEFARKNGFAQTLLGRRRYLPDINSRNASLKNFAERNSVNMPIQGTSADMIKIAMINVYKQLEERHLKSKMILQVHDELVFDVYKPELDEVMDMIKQTMINALPLDGVPIEVGVDVGENWLEAH